ncbi:MAG: hypothetical protein ACYSWO_29695, partial [Planctomycetota bacterium]
SWANGGGATSYGIYFGTGRSFRSGDYKGTQTGTSYDPGTLYSGTTYYWRIDARNTAGTTTGDVWRFTTSPAPPAKAINISPTNRATNQSIDVDISWANGGGATSYGIYFGTGRSFRSGDYKGTRTHQVLQQVMSGASRFDSRSKPPTTPLPQTVPLTSKTIYWSGTRQARLSSTMYTLAPRSMMSTMPVLPVR